MCQTAALFSSFYLRLSAAVFANYIFTVFSCMSKFLHNYNCAMKSLTSVRTQQTSCIVTFWKRYILSGICSILLNIRGTLFPSFILNIRKEDHKLLRFMFSPSVFNRFSKIFVDAFQLIQWLWSVSDRKTGLRHRTTVANWYVPYFMLST